MLGDGLIPTFFVSRQGPPQARKTPTPITVSWAKTKSEIYSITIVRFPSERVVRLRAPYDQRGESSWTGEDRRGRGGSYLGILSSRLIVFRCAFVVQCMLAQTRRERRGGGPRPATQPPPSMQGAYPVTEMSGSASHSIPNRSCHHFSAGCAVGVDPTLPGSLSAAHRPSTSPHNDHDGFVPTSAPF